MIGSVDGNRLWGKELNMSLKFVEWSPDGKFILFVTNDSEIWVYDSNGSKLRMLSLQVMESIHSDELNIVGIQWFCPFNGKLSIQSVTVETLPSLVIAFDNGSILLLRSETDSDQIIIDTELNITSCKWDNTGNLLHFTSHFCYT